jgi:GTP pyrophosphokinase
MNINMKRLNFESDSGIFRGNIILSVKTNKEADKLIQKLKILNGIDKIKRK